MLLIDDDEAEVLPLHRIFYQRMRADEDMDRAVHQSVMDRHAVLRRDATGEQSHMNGISERRQEILEWAYKKEGRFILEDDYDSEFRFVGKPLPTLQGIDSKNRVIYINTFSKTMSPSFRISYMVLPKNIALEFGKKLSFYSCQVSSFEQFTLARFIESGNYEKHINRMKNYYRSLRNNLISAFQKSDLSEIFTIREENSGIHFLLLLKKDLDAGKIQEEWRERGINIPLLSEYFYGENKNPETAAAFVVNYSGIPREKISEIAARMSQGIFFRRRFTQINADISFPSV